MMPGGPRNARQMQMMMRRLGMKSEPLEDVEEVIVRTKKVDHVFRAPEVTIISVQGVTTYQIVGNPETRPRTAPPPGSSGASPMSPAAPAGPPEEDVELVMEQGGVDRGEAIQALAATNGEPAEAILKILARRGGGGG
jgi:nascent polypeptide-associated complex subunit alpha